MKNERVASGTQIGQCLERQSQPQSSMQRCQPIWAGKCAGKPKDGKDGSSCTFTIHLSPG